MVTIRIKNQRKLISIKKQKILVTNHLVSFDTIRTAQKTTLPNILRCRRDVFTELLHINDGEYRDRHTYTPNNSSIVACIRYRGNVFTEPLPRNERRDILYRAFA
jgi:hypothetical protein